MNYQEKEQVRQATIEKTVYIVGYNDPDNHYHFEGAYGSEEEAINAMDNCPYPFFAECQIEYVAFKIK